MVAWTNFVCPCLNVIRGCWYISNDSVSEHGCFLPTVLCPGPDRLSLAFCPTIIVIITNIKANSHDLRWCNSKITPRYGCFYAVSTWNISPCMLNACCLTAFLLYWLIVPAFDILTVITIVSRTAVMVAVYVNFYTVIVVDSCWIIIKIAVQNLHTHV